LGERIKRAGSKRSAVKPAREDKKGRPGYFIQVRLSQSYHLRGSHISDAGDEEKLKRKLRTKDVS